jgi:hypothetical protein
MTTIQLKEFIKTGKFGTIGIGSTKTDVINLLGEDFDIQMDENGEFKEWVEVKLAEKEEDAVLNGIRLFEY